MINKKIESSINFLANHQENDGSFLSLTSPSQEDFKNAHECQSVFSTALILSCLNALAGSDNKEPKRLKGKAVDFLLSQKSENWSFNYWARGSRQAEEMPYPDDLDDTACALAALYEYDAELIDGEVLANIVSVLTVLEVEEGGPYRTWLVPPHAQKAWLDVDLAVNSNIGYFLSLQEAQLESIEKLVESAIDNEKYESPYYPHTYPIIYFISRFYKGAKTGEIIAFLLRQQKDDNWGNPLDTALAMLALLNFGYSEGGLAKNIEYLFQGMKEDGSWEANVFYTGINPNQKTGDKSKYYAGSPALTTAFCVAAIYRASNISNTKEEQLPITPNTSKEEVIYQCVIQDAKKSFSNLGDDLKKQAEVCLKDIITSNKDKQIILLPYLFSNSVNQKLPADYQSKVIDLGLANLYGWMAYTIYDDFLDEEGDPRMLSVANFCLRGADRIFSIVLPETDFADFAKEVFNRIDSANAWEVAHCRIKEKTIASAISHPVPNFEDITHLADRSLGHTLGPTAVLVMLGSNTKSKENKSVLEGLRHYISAKQIHDDMHDWEDDLSRGQINSASATLFLSVNKKLVPKNESDALHFLQKTFWEETVLGLCDKSFMHLEQARRLLLYAGVSQAFIDELLRPLLATTEKTLKERSEAKKFITAYAKGNSESV